MVYQMKYSKLLKSISRMLKFLNLHSRLASSIFGTEFKFWLKLKLDRETLLKDWKKPDTTKILIIGRFEVKSLPIIPFLARLALIEVPYAIHFHSSSSHPSHFQMGTKKRSSSSSCYRFNDA